MSARAQSPEGRVVDRVVAVVNGRAITYSELDFEARVTIIQHGGAQAAQAPLTVAALRQALDLAIAQRLAGDEADRLGAFGVEEADVAESLKAFREQIGGEAAERAFLARQDAEPSQLVAVLARQLKAERLLDRKVRLRAQVSEADVRRAYDARAELQREPFEKARPLLREKLLRGQYTALVAQELQASRRNATVRMVAPWARGLSEEIP